MTVALVREDGVHEIWEDAPCGRVLTRQHWKDGQVWRQDIEVHIKPGLFTLAGIDEWAVTDLKLLDAQKKVVDAKTHKPGDPPRTAEDRFVKEG